MKCPLRVSHGCCHTRSCRTICLWCLLCRQFILEEQGLYAQYDVVVDSRIYANTPQCFNGHIAKQIFSRNSMEYVSVNFRWQRDQVTSVRVNYTYNTYGCVLHAVYVNKRQEPPITTDPLLFSDRHPIPCLSLVVCGVRCFRLISGAHSGMSSDDWLCPR